MTEAVGPSSPIEVVRETPRGAFSFALFDFDGTISLLREGWQEIMAPLMAEVIAGDSQPTDAIRREVADYIDDSTGVQTVVQMEHLADMVRNHGNVPEDRILDARGYKQLYNERLARPVRRRIARLETGQATPAQMMLRGVMEFLARTRRHCESMYIFSGTDRDDVRNEARVLGVDGFFDEIWGSVGDVRQYSKEKVLRDLAETHGLKGSDFLVVGDGPVELRCAKQFGGTAVGVASDERRGAGWDMVKRERLLQAGADILVPDFTCAGALGDYLFGP